MKRVLDLVIVSMALPFLFPVMVLVAIIVRGSLGKPVLFRQIRPGLNGRPFVMMKFRTMKEVRNEDGEPLADRDRMTRIGNLLRSTSLDELPSLWNVLKGDMSLVGPRPLLMEYLPLYSPFQSRRHEVRPGITGIAQVSGRNALSWEEKFALDVWYVENHSLWTDMKILWRTVRKVLRREGIAAEGEATMPRFTGSEH